jgi:hypothetical protein
MALPRVFHGQLGRFRRRYRRAHGRRRARYLQQQALGCAFGLDRVITIERVVLAFMAFFGPHLHFQRAVGTVVDEEDGGVRTKGPVGYGVAGAVRVRAQQGETLIGIDRADRLPDGRIARRGHHIQGLFAGGGQIDGVAELDLHLARRQRFGADDVVAHVVAFQEVAEILLVQGRKGGGQVAHAGAAGQVAVVVDVFLGQHQRHVRKAAGGVAPALLARRAFQQVAQQRLACKQGHAGGLPQGVGIEDIADFSQYLVLYVDRHD